MPLADGATEPEKLPLDQCRATRWIGNPTPRGILPSRSPLYYIELSMGSPETMLKTTTDTISQRKRGIVPAEMPATISDAVILTRRLGTRYLWIDALCIVQDSEEDWLEQAARMGEIYAGSYLSISAHSAHDVKSGFLHVRNALELRGCLHPTLFPNVHVDGKVVCPNIPKPEVAVMTSTLSTRGWTLQEQRLPRRVLHWGPHEISWECNEMMASERQPVQRPKSTNVGVFSGGITEEGTMSLSARNHSNSYTRGFTTRESIYGPLNDRMFADDDLIGSWYNLVQEYSMRTFTFSKDRLPAIAGLAKAYQSRFSKKRTYLAGLWYEDIIRSMTWEKMPTLEQNRNPDASTRRAPSFSWASVEFPISYSAHLFCEDEDAKALGFDVKTKHQDLFGEVESA